MVACDAERPRGRDQPGGDNELRLVAESGVGLFRGGELGAVKELVEDCGMGGGLVICVGACADLVNLGGEVLHIVSRGF